MITRQIELSNGKRVVIEGRDIATNVLPNADLKIFLTADIDTRTMRRQTQLKNKNVDISFEDVKMDIINRDTLDSEREISPLKMTDDAFVIDTTNDTLSDTELKVTDELKKRNLL